MRMLFLTEGPEIPSSRYRVEQFVPHFEAAGIRCTVRFAYGTTYNRVNERPWAAVYKTATRLRRAAWTVLPGKWDLIFLQRSALPGTAAPERLRHAFGSARIVFDVDDAIYLGPDFGPSPLRAAKFRDLARISDAVIAGNSHLAERVAAPKKTVVIPTAVDTEVYQPPPARDPSRLVVGWMGTSSNFPSLREVLPALLRTIAPRPNAVLRIVSNGRLPELDSEQRVEQQAWSAETEVRQLQSFDVGLMPLLDTEATLGKCGFKMLQYMAVGAAPLASGVGANLDLVGRSQSALLLPPRGDWEAALGRLLDDAEQRAALQQRARAHVHAHYSVRTTVPRYLELFRRLTQEPRPQAPVAGLQSEA